MDFKIPSRYTIGGQDVTIEIVESDGNDYGNYTQAKGVLRICKKVGETPQSDTVQLNTFFHELTHSVLGIMGEIELNNNERFVSCFSSFLTEAIRTMELFYKLWKHRKANLYIPTNSMQDARTTRHLICPMYLRIWRLSNTHELMPLLKRQSVGLITTTETVDAILTDGKKISKKVLKRK